MEQAIEVASLVRGELTSVKRLSPARERRQVLAAAAAVAAGVVGALLLVIELARAFGQLLYAPGLVLAWLAAAVVAVTMAVRRTRARARRYSIGSDIDVDAFASVDCDLVRRGKAGYDVGIVPGMTGALEGARSSAKVEALLAGGPQRLELPPGWRATIGIGSTTFVVRWAPPDRAAEPPAPRLHGLGLGKLVLGAAQAATLLTLVCLVPATPAITDGQMRSRVPLDATPWETEKLIRVQAQEQSSKLHRCFDPLPLQCQRAGYVAVGLALTRDGEVASTRVSRSTYGQECPVASCMADEAGTWFFEPMPERIEVVLPIQVLRTDRPLVVGGDLEGAPAPRSGALPSGRKPALLSTGAR